MRNIYLKVFLLIIFCTLYSCNNNGVSTTENQKMGIEFKGKESLLNGSYKATFLDSYNFTTQQFFSLQDGKVISSKYGSPGVDWFISNGSGGYIGYYSFDGKNFMAAMNCSASDAPIYVVTDRCTGTVDSITINAVWSYNAGTTAEEKDSMKLVKYSDGVDIYQ